MPAGLRYPWIIEFGTTATGGSVLISEMWLAVPATLVPLGYLDIPPVLLACAVAGRSIRRRRPDTAA